MQSSANFWNKIAPRYAKSADHNEQVYNHKLKITQRYLKLDMRVLEFGCGTGTTALLHAPFVKEYIATDIAQEMIRIAEQKRVDDGVANVKFSVGTITSAWEQEQQFDAVLRLNVLHLLTDWCDQMETIYRLLPAGGLFITSTACLKEKLPWSWLRFVAPLLHRLPCFQRWHSSANVNFETALFKRVLRLCMTGLRKPVRSRAFRSVEKVPRFNKILLKPKTRN